MIEIIKKDMLKKLEAYPKRITHVLGVSETAKELAIYYNLDSEKALIAGLLHDYMKYESIDSFKQLIDESLIEKYKDTPVIYHAIAASDYYLNTYGNDQEIYEAIRYHVWGNFPLSEIVKVVFVSDYCEPSRTIPDRAYIYDLAYKDLDACVLYCMEATIKDLKRRNLTISEEQRLIYEKFKEYLDAKN